MFCQIKIKKSLPFGLALSFPAIELSPTFRPLKINKQHQFECSVQLSRVVDPGFPRREGGGANFWTRMHYSSRITVHTCYQRVAK